MTGNLGGYVCSPILINIVIRPMSHKNSPSFGYLSKQFLPFQTEAFSLMTPVFRFCASRFSSSCRI
jgi:hypothetical protein